MKRKAFLKSIGAGTLGTVVIGASVTACGGDDTSPTIDPNACTVSPSETAGPFPIKTPAQLIRENIVGDRAGIPLVINIKIENTNNNCLAMAGVQVDIWHCDAKGNYSEYNQQLDGDFTNEHFLRGRQTTNAQGVASFLSIYPGWYPGRAPHLHIEILSAGGTSLLITQTAFPEDVSNTIYATGGYKGNSDTNNGQDGEFSDSLTQNLASTVTGNLNDGYVLNETIKVAG